MAVYEMQYLNEQVFATACMPDFRMQEALDIRLFSTGLSTFLKAIFYQMKKEIIPKEVQEEVEKIIDAFNKKNFKDTTQFRFIPEFKGKFLYLKRKERELLSPVVRLTYNGNMKKWGFAIFKWSSETYDPGEWFFPGAKYADGTIEGALKAGNTAYPV